VKENYSTLGDQLLSISVAVTGNEFAGVTLETIVKSSAEYCTEKFNKYTYQHYLNLFSAASRCLFLRKTVTQSLLHKYSSNNDIALDFLIGLEQTLHFVLLSAKRVSCLFFSSSSTSFFNFSFSCSSIFCSN
jgi:hypothetical protein